MIDSLGFGTVKVILTMDGKKSITDGVACSGSFIKLNVYI